MYNVQFWDRDILCHKKAKQLISAWNESHIVNKRYTLSSMPWISVCKESNGNLIERDTIKPNEIVLCEEYIEGDWKKWNSNSGYVRDQQLSIEAFSHFTYHHSKGRYIMVDCQGVRNKNQYIISDPCICSLHKGTYGITDIGDKGIASFFANHRCNQFCKPYWLKPNKMKKAKSIKKVTKHTTYIFNVSR